MLGARPEEMANAAAEQFECNYGKRNIPRGGLCVHRPAALHHLHQRRFAAAAAAAGNSNGDDDNDNHDGNNDDANNASNIDLHDDYLTFTRNMFLQTPRPSGQMSIDEIWDNVAQKRFGGAAAAAAASPATLSLAVLSTEKKRGRKRKVVLENDVVEKDDNVGTVTSPTPPPSTKVMAIEENATGFNDCIDEKPAAAEMSIETQSKSILPLCGLEDDERMLSFLQANHGGDLEKAKFSILVNADRGYGMFLCCFFVTQYVPPLVCSQFCTQSLICSCPKEETNEEKAKGITKRSLRRCNILLFRIMAMESQPGKVNYAW
jgi:hypothetical protein